MYIFSYIPIFGLVVTFQHGVWKRYPVFRVLPLLVMESAILLHMASLLRLLSTSGQSVDAEVLSKTDHPAKYPWG